MDDQRRRPDPSSRPDPYELAIQRAASSEDREPGPEDDGTPPLPRLQAGPFRVGPVGLLVGVLLLVAVGSLVRFDGGRGPQVEPSCTVPGLALSAKRVPPGGLLRYAARGRDGEVVLEVAPLTAAGTPGEPVQVLPPARLQDCAVRGVLGVQAPPGEYVVVLRRAGRPYGSAPLTVTEPGDPDVG